MDQRGVTVQTTVQRGGEGVPVGSRRGGLLYIVTAPHIAKGFFSRHKRRKYRSAISRGWWQIPGDPVGENPLVCVAKEGVNHGG